MSRPIPLAIISFLLGVLAVVMFIAPRYYTIEDALFSNREYAEHIVAQARVVANADISLAIAGDPALYAGTVAVRPAAGGTVPTAEPNALPILSPAAADNGYSLVIQLQNTGNLGAWGRFVCRVNGFYAPLLIPVEDLRPNMAAPATFIIPLGSPSVPEEGWQVRARWEKLYVK